MELIIKEDCPEYGFYVGERVKVKSGFARNYLLPKGMAVEASSSSARELQHHINQINAKKDKLKRQAEELSEKIKGEALEFKLKIGEGGKSFGAVTTQDIHKSLVKQGYDVERRAIRLHEGIRTVGSYVVEIKLHSEVFAPLEITVVADKAAKKKLAQEKKAKKAAEEAGDSDVSADEAVAASEEVVEEKTTESVSEEAPEADDVNTGNEDDNSEEESKS